MVDLELKLLSIAKIAEFKDDGHVNEELSGLKDRIDSIHDKVMTWEVDQYRIWDSRLDEVKEYLEAVDEIRRLIERLESLNLSEESDELELLIKANGVLQTSMKRIEEEFRHMLVQNRQNFEPEGSSSWSTEYDGLDDGPQFSLGESSFDDSTPVDSIRGDGIYIMDLVNPKVIPDLKSIASLMFDSNYGKECSQAFISVCRDALDECLYILEVDKTRIGDVLRMDWPALNSKIRTWTKGRIFVRTYLASQKFLCEQIFGDRESVSSFCFSKSSKGSVLQLLKFAKAISVGSHQPEELLGILDMYETLADLTPDIESFYPDDNGLYLRTEFHDVLTRVGKCVTSTFHGFKKAVGSDVSNAALPGGGIHPLTRYVMNYIRTLIEYNSSLHTLLKDHIEADDQESSSSPDASPAIEDDITNENSPSSLMGLHIRSLISVLESNLEEKSKLYKEEALGHLFLINNINYMAEKVKSSELRNVLGDNWIRRRNWTFQQHAMGSLQLHEVTESASSPHRGTFKSEVTQKDIDQKIKKIVLQVKFDRQDMQNKAMKAISKLSGIDSIMVNKAEGTLTVTGDVHPVEVVSILRKVTRVDLISVGPAKGHRKGTFASDQVTESTSSPHRGTFKSEVTQKDIDQKYKKIVLHVKFDSRDTQHKAMKAISELRGIDSITINKTEGTLTVIGDADPVEVASKLRKVERRVELISVGPAKGHRKGTYFLKRYNRLFGVITMK